MIFFAFFIFKKIVQPASLIPSMAKMSGAKLMFINKQPTTFDHVADLVLYGKAGVILPRIFEKFQKKVENVAKSKKEDS